LEGKYITIQFPARTFGIEGKLKKRLFRENEYKIIFNETPGNINGLFIIQPIYPADAVPKNARNYHFLKLLDGEFRLSSQNS
jgi:hypothetical protein